MNSLTKIALVVLVLAVLGEGFYILKTSQSSKKQEVLDQNVSVDTAQIKKEAMIGFDSKISDVIKSRNFGVLYDLSSKTTQTYFTRDQFIKLRQDEVKNALRWMNITASNIQVNNDLGTIEKTYYACQDSLLEQARKWLEQNPTDVRAEKVKEKISQSEKGSFVEGFIDGKEMKCFEGDVQTSQQTVKYSYFNGQWGMYDPMPTDRALKVSSSFFSDMSKTARAEMEKSWGQGSGSQLFAIRNFAHYLDENEDALVHLETLTARNEADRNRPIVNVQQPDVSFPTSKLQIEAAPRHCTSSALGSSVYTNCY